jgi:membrane protein
MEQTAMSEERASARYFYRVMISLNPLRLWAFIKEVFFAADRNRLTGSAAELAFWNLSSLAPMLLIMVGALGSIDAVFGSDLAGDAEGQLLDLVERVFGQQSTVDNAFRDLFANSNSGALTVGAIVTAYFASRGFTSLVGTLDRIYERKPRRGPTGFIITRAVGVVLGVLSLVVLGVTLAGVFAITEVSSNAALIRPLVAVGVLVLLTTWTATLYHWAPRQRTKWSHDLPGALVAAIGVAVATIGVGYYASLVPGSNNVVGVLGGLVVFLTWLWVSSLAVLIGGQINALTEVNQPHRRADAVEDLGLVDPTDQLD